MKLPSLPAITSPKRASTSSSTNATVGKLWYSSPFIAEPLFPLRLNRVLLMFDFLVLFFYRFLFLDFLSEFYMESERSSRSDYFWLLVLFLGESSNSDCCPYLIRLGLKLFISGCLCWFLTLIISFRFPKGILSRLLFRLAESIEFFISSFK